MTKDEEAMWDRVSRSQVNSLIIEVFTTLFTLSNLTFSTSFIEIRGFLLYLAMTSSIFFTSAAFPFVANHRGDSSAYLQANKKAVFKVTADTKISQS